MTKRKNFGTDVDVAEVEAEVVNAGAEVAELAAEIAALKKEVAALKEEIGKKSASTGGGVDPRVDKLVEVIKSHRMFKERVEKVNL